MNARHLALWISLSVAGCGDGGPAGPDAGPGALDAMFEPPPCEVEFGTSYALSELRIPPADTGLDLDGDGDVDNELAVLAPVANATLSAGIEDGSAVYLFDAAAWDAPPASDPDLGLALYAGMDADDPPTIDDNFSGDGEYLVLDRQFDVNCQARTAAEQSSLDSSRVVRASSPRWPVLFPSVGSVDFMDARVVAEFDPEYRTLTGLLGGAWAVCFLSQTAGPDLDAVSLLDALVRLFRLSQTDIDLDGDGLERVVGGPDGIVECVDGDGTVIPGADCACDPRMRDGYSMGVAFTAAPARIVGIAITE